MQKPLPGLHHFMPDKVWKWKLLEKQVDHELTLHDYQEIRLSVLQDYHVIHDGITALMQENEAHQATEGIVNLSQPNGDISLLTLRPEGTISVLHHTAKVIRDKDIHRYYYLGPMFRKEKDSLPSEFFQLGVELLGSSSIMSENEVISIGMKICQNLGLRDVYLRLNSFGCHTCRHDFFEDMRKHLSEHRAEYCDSCYQNLYANPFADTQCEDPKCQQALTSGPQIGDYLCKQCKTNFAKVKKIQANLGYQYKVDNRLFKNFAYYNETVFDFVLSHQGQEIVIGGGGRYDYLSQKITGKNIPAVGFYLNMDSVFEIMESRGLFDQPAQVFTVYISSQSEDLEIMMLQIAQELHTQNIKTILSTEKIPLEQDAARALKAQCSLMIIIREDNIREGKILMRNLAKEHQDYIPLGNIIPEILLARKALNNE